MRPGNRARRRGPNAVPVRQEALKAAEKALRLQLGLPSALREKFKALLRSCLSPLKFGDNLNIFRKRACGVNRQTFGPDNRMEAGRQLRPAH